MIQRIKSILSHPVVPLLAFVLCMVGVVALVVSEYLANGLQGSHGRPSVVVLLAPASMAAVAIMGMLSRKRG